MFIYASVNQLTGKVYIGRTVNSVRERFNGHIKTAHKKLKSGERYTHFQNALRKYGSEMFETEVIDTANSLEELNKKEIFWIEVYYARDRKFGYNEAPGGEGFGSGELHPCYGKVSHLKGKTWEEISGVEKASENKKVKSNKMKGNKHAQGSKHTDDWKQNKSKAMSGENHPMYGKSSPGKGSKRISTKYVKALGSKNTFARGNKGWFTRICRTQNLSLEEAQKLYEEGKI